MNSKYSIYFIIPLCIIILFFACSGKGEDGPAIEFKAEIYDFGKVNEGEKVNYAFVFKNVGKETVLITSVRPTCGCTVTGEYDREVPPGASGKIPVELRTVGYQGEISKIIRVTTNVPQKNEIILTLKGSVYTAVSVNPRVLWLGEIKASAISLKGYVTVKNNSDKPLKIEKIIPPHKGVALQSTTIKQDQEYRIDITINPPFGNGRVIDAILIETNNPDKKSINVQYSYNVRAEISVYPQIIYIEPGEQKEKFERVITIDNSLPEPVKIFNPQITGGTLDFHIQELDPGKLYQIKLLFPKGFTITGKEMLIFTFHIQRSLGTDVYNIAIKPVQ